MRRKFLRAVRYVSLSEKVDKDVGYEGYVRTRVRPTEGTQHGQRMTGVAESKKVSQSVRVAAQGRTLEPRQYRI